MKLLCVASRFFENFLKGKSDLNNWVTATFYCASKNKETVHYRWLVITTLNVVSIPVVAIINSKKRNKNFPNVSSDRSIFLCSILCITFLIIELVMKTCLLFHMVENCQQLWPLVICKDFRLYFLSMEFNFTTWNVELNRQDSQKGHSGSTENKTGDYIGLIRMCEYLVNTVWPNQLIPFLALLFLVKHWWSS